MQSQKSMESQEMAAQKSKYQPSHIVVFVARIKSDGEPEWLLMRRCGVYLNGNWQMVTGNIELGESTISAAKRELFEETGFKPEFFYNGDFLESFWEKSKDRIQFGPVFLAIVGNSVEVTLSPEEHDQYQWVSTEMARNILEFRSQREALNHIVSTFIEKKPSEFFLIDG